MGAGRGLRPPVARSPRAPAPPRGGRGLRAQPLPAGGRAELARPPFLPYPPSPRPASRGSPRGGVHRGRGGRASQGAPRRGLLLLLRSPAASPSRAPRSRRRSPRSLGPHGPSAALTRGLSPAPPRPRHPDLPAPAVTVPGGSDAEPGGRSCASSDSGRRRQRRREEREAAPRADGAKKDPRARRSRSYTISVST